MRTVKALLLLLCVSVLIALFGYVFLFLREHTSHVIFCDVKDWTKRVRTNNALVIDVRDPAIARLGSYEGAMNIQLDEMDIAQHNKLCVIAQQRGSVAIYCQDGTCVDALSFATLVSTGCDNVRVYYLIGGYESLQK